MKRFIQTLVVGFGYLVAGSGLIVAALAISSGIFHLVQNPEFWYLMLLLLAMCLVVAGSFAVMFAIVIVVEIWEWATDGIGRDAHNDHLAAKTEEK